MKISLSFSSSPSSVSSSSTTNASSVFDGNLCNSHTNGCLPGVLRRLLCAGSLRTHPFDCVKDGNGVDSGAHKKDLNFITKNVESGSMTPGLVARLMGLESLPDSSSARRRIPDSIGRSRSVNSANYWSEFDPTQGQQRRVKSFREMPTFLHKENDEFLVLSFEKTGESGGFRSNEQRKKSDRGDRRVEHKCEIEELKMGRSVKKELKSERTKLEKTKKKMKGTKKHGIVCEEKNRGAECDSENSSPVSVLDLDDFLSKSETVDSDEKPRLASSNSRRDLSLELAKPEKPKSNFIETISEEINQESTRSTVKNKKQVQSGGVEGKRKKSHDDDGNSDKQLELWRELCRLAEEEILNSSWMTRGVCKIEEFEEIEIDVAVEILDKLVNEVATEMVKF
ncbi:hypothetical protein Sjap_014121 [Stephania japonica]|uniref:DUF3741 domain-containing protein n=1 Tax=Stephania japonica TaxID=461633 RepID=A0AAP0IZ68_9MAGN